MAKEMRVRFVITLSVLVLVVSMSEGLSHAQQQDNRTYGGLKPNEILIINDDKSVTVPINLRNGGYGSYTRRTTAIPSTIDSNTAIDTRSFGARVGIVGISI